MIKHILCPIILLCLSFNTLAANKTAATIRQQATAFVKNQVSLKPFQRAQVVAANIDPRTNFQQCKTFHYYLTNNEIRKDNTVRVTCDESNNFRLYVPVKVKTLIPVVTMKNTANSGDMLDSSDLTVSYIDQTQIFGSYYSDINSLLGAKLKRRVNRNSPLTGYDICIVCRGDTVKIVASGKGFYISAGGTALADGLVGDTIRVRNNQSQRVITALIKSVGQVMIRM
ncbi:flagellar basal body P-ring formation chaperone FlgA [Celerinatantimonas yamalensis]|uniref:Flagella basal body P-ring formation protein FlgA n=1 Tax=Celerinatantimonas yamalensis TaxID=559956 RepID=A0ABW9G5Y4_9GAMM